MHNILKCFFKFKNKDKIKNQVRTKISKSENLTIKVIEEYKKRNLVLL